MSKLQVCLEFGVMTHPDLSNEVASDACIKKLSRPIAKALAESTPKCRHRDDPRTSILAGVRDKIRLMNRLRGQWHITREPDLGAKVYRLQRSVTHQLKEWRDDQWMYALESLSPEDQSPRNVTRSL